MLVSLDAADSSHIAALSTIWTAACGPLLAISERTVQFNLKPATGAVQAGRLFVREGRPVGFVLASALPADPATSPPETGWIDAIAVLPGSQQSGIGAQLMDWAEDWLKGQRCTRSRLGGSLRPFAPGLPVELGTEAFFRKRGYQGRPASPQTWDVARDLGNYQTPPSVAPSMQASMRPARPGDEPALLDFFQREFPGRWRYDFQEFMRDGGRLSDYHLLWTGGQVDGFCQLSWEDSWRPIERFYLQPLPRPWGQLGPIGVSASVRGRSLGGALLNAGLLRLRDSGVRGCVIDWTGLIDFYGKFGFARYHAYAVLFKELA